MKTKLLIAIILLIGIMAQSQNCHLIVITTPNGDSLAYSKYVNSVRVNSINMEFGIVVPIGTLAFVSDYNGKYEEYFISKPCGHNKTIKMLLDEKPAGAHLIKRYYPSIDTAIKCESVLLHNMQTYDQYKKYCNKMVLDTVQVQWGQIQIKTLSSVDGKFTLNAGTDTIFWYDWQPVFEKHKMPEYEIMKDTIWYGTARMIRTIEYRPFIKKAVRLVKTENPTDEGFFRWKVKQQSNKK